MPKGFAEALEEWEEIGQAFILMSVRAGYTGQLPGVHVSGTSAACSNSAPPAWTLA